MAVRIYVDQGHNPGNINAGASGNGVVESEVTYWVGIYLAGFLYADQRFEVKVSRPFRIQCLAMIRRAVCEQE